jgi:micrococcal nuclease
VADFYAPELSSPEGPAAKAAREEVALGRQAICRAEKKSYDRVVAACSIGGRSIGASMRAMEVREGGRGYRP